VSGSVCARIRQTQTMRGIVNVPDEPAAALTRESGDPAKTAPEVMALEAHRDRRITAYRLRTLLGTPKLFRDRGIESYTAENFEDDLARLNYLVPIGGSSSATDVLSPLYARVVVPETVLLKNGRCRRLLDTGLYESPNHHHRH
jgi:hypothetical protein